MVNQMLDGSLCPNSFPSITTETFRCNVDSDQNEISYQARPNALSGPKWNLILVPSPLITAKTL